MDPVVPLRELAVLNNAIQQLPDMHPLGPQQILSASGVREVS